MYRQEESLAVRMMYKFSRLHFHHIDGLQPSVLSQENGLTVTIQAIQIYNLPGHWVTSSSIGENLAVYDSKFTGGASLDLTN